MFTVLDSEKEAGVAPGKDAQRSVYVVCPCIAVEALGVPPVDKVFQIPVGLDAVPSPLVPVTVHDDAFVTAQLIFVVSPLRINEGLTCRCSVTVTAGNIHGSDPSKLVAVLSWHVVGAGQLDSCGGSAGQLPAQSYTDVLRCPQELTATDSHGVPDKRLHTVVPFILMSLEGAVPAGVLSVSGVAPAT